MILSHHGKLEFGSPKVPQFPEALLLHYLDDMDSKMEAMRAQIENDRQLEGCFTSYNSALERSALKKDKYLNPPAEPAPAPKPPPAPKLAPAPAPNPPTAPKLAPAPAAAPPPKADHPLFAAPSSSPFADKLTQALKPAAPKQEN